ncbi:Uncharacterized protein SCF082_LOCUS42796 [Durusdinium trenchii]|uniref:Uncharacterized protein n=1 Tax=Durusdinium trenchii TaxID=1381693 RepID=A0ABP0QR56_9DINO
MLWWIGGLVLSSAPTTLGREFIGNAETKFEFGDYAGMGSNLPAESASISEQTLQSALTQGNEPESSLTARPSSEEMLPRDAQAWESKTKSPPSQTCPTCCRGSEQTECSKEKAQVDPCSGKSDCTGFHRCFGAKRGFLQCQYQPDSDVHCQSGPNCLPECAGEQLGKDDDDCSLQPIEKCDGYVWRVGRATQYKIEPGGNPSGADICANAYFCGVR